MHHTLHNHTAHNPNETKDSTSISLVKALRLAVQMHRNRHYDGAETLYQRILHVAPQQSDALHFLGMLHYQTGRSSEGIALIHQAIAIEPEFAGYHNNLGNIHASQGRILEATQAYERALELAPQDADLHNNLGALYKHARRFDDARVCYERAIALDPRHINALNNMGLLHAELGDRPQAIRYYVESLELMPGNSSARKLLGTTYYALGRIADAAEVYRQWLEIDPDHPMARHHYAACSGQNVPERAADEYVEQTFDGFAASFEATLNERLHYQAPQLCVDLLAEIMPAPLRQYVVLDAGCGTGLCGPLLAPWSRTLAGVDLSRGMLDLAQTKGVYQDLYKAELGEFLQLSPAQWDVIVSADTLCYFGELRSVMRAAAASLRPGGTLVFTVEALEGVGTVQPGPKQIGTFHIQPHGRYAHTRFYLADVLGQAGLRVLALRDAVLRQEGGKPVQGWLVAARRPGQAAA